VVKGLHQQRGMTLLELLVAAAVMAVLAGLAFMGLDNMATAKRVIDEQNRTLNQQNLALFWLQSDLQLATVHPNPLITPAQAEFSGDSQGFSLLRFQSPTVSSGRNDRRQVASNDAHGLVRVRWYVRNNQWYRATQSAFAPPNSNQWLERPMLALRTVNCQYLNLTGQLQPVWPQGANQGSQLPQRISCGLTDDAGQNSVLNVVPWQHLGFL
jgi:prepilin-type N-terminal cleavage/methylation domain-containing protein